MERTPAQSPERSYHEAGEIVFSRIAKPTTAPEDTCDRIMASSHEQLPTTGRSSDDLTGLDVLLVEDSWDVGQAVKALLELCRATVAGPAALRRVRQREQRRLAKDSNINRRLRGAPITASRTCQKFAIGMGLLQKTRTRAGFLCLCGGNIELHYVCQVEESGVRSPPDVTQFTRRPGPLPALPLLVDETDALGGPSGRRNQRAPC